MNVVTYLQGNDMGVIRENRAASTAITPKHTASSESPDTILSSRSTPPCGAYTDVTGRGDWKKHSPTHGVHRSDLSAVVRQVPPRHRVLQLREEVVDTHLNRTVSVPGVFATRSFPLSKTWQIGHIAFCPSVEKSYPQRSTLTAASWIRSTRKNHQKRVARLMIAIIIHDRVSGRTR